jgi:plasmid maintenance system antidote protein VapI
MAQQLTPQELQELVKLYEKINGLTRTAAQNQANQAINLGNARDELERLSDIWNDFVNDLSNTERQFARLTDQIKGQRSGITQAASAYDKLRGISAKINDIQDRTAKTSLKELNSLREKAASERKRLEIAKDLLQDQLRNSQLGTQEYYKTRLALLRVNKTLSDQEGHFEAINEALNREEKKLKDIQKSLGLSGALMKGISKIPIIGNLPGMSEALGEIEEEIVRIRNEEGRLVSRGEALGMTFKKIGPIIKESLTDPLVIGGFFLTKIISGFKELDKAQVEYTRQTGRNVEHFDTLNTGLTTSSQYIKQATALTKQFGIAADAIFTSQTIQEATEMVELMGMGAEEAGTLARFSKLSGKELKDIQSNIVQQVSNFNKVNRTGINQRQILEAVAKTSDHIAMTFGGNPEKIANAVSEAKKLGLTLEQIDKIAESILNFEESISAELEAELLTGKQINLDQARYYALTNQLTELTKEIGNNQEIISTFTTGNRIQQEAIAKSMGLSREEMAKMIYDQRMINGLSDEQLEKVTGMTAEDMKRLSLQDSINNSIQKMSEALAGPLEFFSKIVSNAYVLNSIIAFITTVGLVKMAAGLITNLTLLGLIGKRQAQNAAMAGVEAGANAASSAAKVPIIGPILAIAALATVIGGVMAAISKAKTPGLAKGGTVVGEGSVLVGEQGPEVLSLKPGATVTPLSKVNAATASNGGMNVSISAGNTIIQLDGVAIAKAITPYVVEEMRQTTVRTQ